ncbi:MAG: response regulator transcription factor [Proteobacteria bacterium]|nr:response regulator transcription factor [Pseudomonadota bacterium]
MSDWKKALIVEDELSLAKALELTLKELKLSSVHVTTLKEAYHLLGQEVLDFDLLLLDRHLPDGDSIQLCRDIRRKGINIAILMLTASGEISDRVDGLRAGADDYLPKPFSWDELMARLEALKRRLKNADTTASSSSEVLEQKWIYDSNTRKLKHPYGECELTDIESKLMKKFLSAPGKALSKKQLLEDVWGLNWLTRTRTVDWFVSQLRKKIEHDPQKPQHLITLRGEGYRFDP